MGNSAWAVTSTWRSDLKLFARIAEKAREEVEGRHFASDCRIEFAVRDDFECYESVASLLECAPSNTVRSFNSARIRVGTLSLQVEVSMGRKKRHKDSSFSCDRGVAVQVTSAGVVTDAVLREIRDSMVKLIARGGFSWGSAPTKGPDDEHPSLEDALAERWHARGLWAQGVFALVTVVLGLVTLAVFLLIGGDREFDSDGTPLGLGLFFGVVMGVVQLASLPLSTLLFPAVELADLAPGRRIFQVIGRSGLP